MTMRAGPAAGKREGRGPVFLHHMRVMFGRFQSAFHLRPWGAALKAALGCELTADEALKLAHYAFLLSGSVSIWQLLVPYPKGEVPPDVKESIEAARAAGRN